MTFTGRYGVDAPYVPAGLALGGAVFVVLAEVLSWTWLISGVLLLASAALYLHTTLRGKHVAWQRELDRLALTGDERLLDVGCGRGAVLIAAAQRLSHGSAEGVDLWRSVDQSGNDPARTTENARAAGVAERIELHTADMTELPFSDAVFDVVTSALAVHNIPTADGRGRAVAEMARVLKPGGRLVLVDIKHVKDYAAVLRDVMTDLECRSLGVNYWYGGPWVAANAVIGTRRVAERGA
jgi:arsenite methyltransferase